MTPGDCIDAKAVKKMTEKQQAHRPGKKGAVRLLLYFTYVYTLSG